jgi:putative NADPH-quinone reductase
MRNVLILNGHPDPESLCAALAHAYCRGARAGGHRPRVLNVSELKFDPVLHRGYKGAQALEPDLVMAQQSILEADHLVVVFPIWWSSVPALFKGFLDRVLLPGFAFKYRKSGPLWDRLLAGRTGEILLTTDAPNWWNRWILNDPAINMMKKGVLAFCGIRVKRITRFASVKSRAPEQIARFLEKAEKLGANGFRTG